MKVTKRLAMAAAMTVACLSGTPAQAQTGQPAPLLFDDFLFDNGGQPAEDFNGFFQFTVTGGSVDLVGGDVPGAPGGPPFGRFVDLGGSTGNPGRFESTFPIPVVGGSLLPGQSFTLNFDFRSTGGGLNFGSVFVGDQAFDFSTSSLDFTTFSRTFSFDPSLTTVSVAFQGLESDTDGEGVGIDRIQFGPTLIAAVPEPSAWAMMIVGVGAVGAGLRRRRTARLALA